MRRRIAAIFLALACTDAEPLETAGETSSETGTCDEPPPDLPEQLGWCCDCELVAGGGPPICQASYEPTCGASLVWCVILWDCAGLCTVD